MAEYRGLEALIKCYIDTNKLKLSLFEMARDLYVIAKDYTLLQLANKYAAHMLCSMTVNNACECYEIGLLYDEKAIIEHSLQVIRHRTKYILNHESFLDLKIDTVVELFSDEELEVQCELELFHALERYTQNQKMSGKGPHSPLPEVAGKRFKLEPDQMAPLPDDNSSCIIANKSQVKIEKQSSPPTSPLIDFDFAASPISTDFESHRKTLQLSKFCQILKAAPSAGPPKDIRSALKQIRFLSLSSEQFARGPALSTLLTPDEVVALLGNIVLPNYPISVPQGFSTSREPRCQRNLVPKNLPIRSEAKFVLKVMGRNLPRSHRSVTSAPQTLLGHPWYAKMVPFCESSANGCKSTRSLAVFVRCEAPDYPVWRFHAQVVFKLHSVRAGFPPRTARLGQVLSSQNRECGILKFIPLVDAVYPEWGCATSHSFTVEVCLNVKPVPGDR